MDVVLTGNIIDYHTQGDTFPNDLPTPVIPDRGHRHWYTGSAQPQGIYGLNSATYDPVGGTYDWVGVKNFTNAQASGDAPIILGIEGGHLAEQGVAFSITPTVYNGPATGFTFDNEAGLTALGLSFNATTGEISGTATADGTVTGTLTVTAAGGTDTASVTIIVPELPSDVPGGLVWMDGSDEATKLDAGAAQTAQGAAITTWTNKGSEADAVQPAANKPTDNEAIQGVLFTGNNELEIASSATLAFGDSVTDQPRTLAMWVTWNGTTPARVATQAVDTNTREWLWNIAGSGKISWAAYDTGAANARKIELDHGMNYLAGEPMFLVVTYDGSGTSAGIHVSINRAEYLRIVADAGAYTAMHNTGAPISIARWLETANAAQMDVHQFYVLDHVATEAELDTLQSYRQTQLQPQSFPNAYNTYWLAGTVWFNRPRATYANGYTVISSVSQTSELIIVDHSTGRVRHENMATVYQYDDHNPGANLYLANGTWLAGYCEHNLNNTLRFRRTTGGNPLPGNWGAEQTVTVPAGGTVTYTELVQTDNGDVHCFYRHKKADGDNTSWDRITSTDNGATWSAPVTIFETNDPGAQVFKPYLVIGKHPTNGNRIDMYVQDRGGQQTEHGKIQQHMWWDAAADTYHTTDGTLIAGGAPVAYANMTQVVDGTGDNLNYWVSDLDYDASGNPRLLSQCAEDVATPNDMMLSEFKWNGTAWAKVDVVNMGSAFTTTSPFYSGQAVYLDSADRILVGVQENNTGQPRNADLEVGRQRRHMVEGARRNNRQRD